MLLHTCVCNQLLEQERNKLKFNLVIPVRGLNNASVVVSAYDYPGDVDDYQCMGLTVLCN